MVSNKLIFNTTVWRALKKYSNKVDLQTSTARQLAN